MAYPLNTDQIQQQIIEEVAGFCERNGYETPPDSEVRRIFRLCLAHALQEYKDALGEGIKDPVVMITFSDEDLTSGFPKVPNMEAVARRDAMGILRSVNLGAAARVAANMALEHVITVTLLIEFVPTESYVFAMPK